MKFMKLGSKPDAFQTDGDNVRYVVTELVTDLVANVGDVKFYLHKFPLLSKSAKMQKLVTSANEENNGDDEIYIQDIPGGPAAFEICAKFCYGMIVTLNAYNVVAARCAAEYLEMYETVEKGNLIYKIEVFLYSSIFRGWKDTIIVLKTTNSLLPWSEELKLVSHCLESIASKASIDTSKVEWSYTYNRKKLPSENENEVLWNGVRKQLNVPNDWWVEDICELQLDLFKRVITTVKSSGKVGCDVIGEALNAYAFRRLPGFSKNMITGGDVIKSKAIVETIVRLLPPGRGGVSCGFLMKLLRAAVTLECGETERLELVKRIGQELDKATLSDLLIRSSPRETMIYDVDLVQNLVNEFVTVQERDTSRDPHAVAKLIDSYLVEIASDVNLPLEKFVNLADMISGFSRPSHNCLYRAIDMFLKVHPGISKSERKKICKLMDCSKLTGDVCMHAVQSERLPLRVVVQLLFFEQVRAATSSAGSSTPDLSGSIKAMVPGGSRGSSRSTTTNTEEDWDAVPTSDDIKAIAASKMKGLVMSKRIFSKLWSNKERDNEISSETSESPASTIGEETKSTPSRIRRQSKS